MKKENCKSFDLNKIEVSFYSSRKDTISKEVMTLNRFFGQHAKLDDRVCAVRLIDDKKERDALKCTLPGITPSGIFKTREDTEIIKHSGLICLDFDGLHDSVDDVKEYISRLPYVMYCGLSASGRGLWALIPISDPTQHRAHFKSLQNDFKEVGLTVDPTGINVSRFRFYSFDDHAHFNLRAEKYTRVWYEPVKKEYQYHSTDTNTNTTSPLGRLVKIIMEAPDGQKHYKLLRTAIVAGGYIASNTLNEGETIEALQKAISSRSTVHDINAAFKTIEYGIEKGKDRRI